MKFPPIIFRTIRYLLILISSLLLIAVASNWSLFDEQLEPAAEQNLQTIQMPPPMENAYIASLGIKSEQSFDMFDVGQQLLTHYRTLRSAESNQDFNPTEYQQFEVDSNLDQYWLDALSICNDRTEDRCLDKLSESVKNIPSDSARLIMLAKRYQQIIALKSFVENSDVSANLPFPAYNYLVSLGKLETIRFYNEQHYTLMLQQIEKELNFWQMVLGQGKSLIAKMVAVARIWGNVELLSELIDDKNLSDAERSSLEHMIKSFSLSDEDLDISESFAFEFRYAADFIDTLPALQKLFLQKKSSLNFEFQHMTQPLICLSQLEFDDFKKVYNSIKQSNQVNICNIDWTQNPSTLSRFSLYNLTGRSYLTEKTNVNAADYIARVYDLNGMIQLLHLKLAARNHPDQSISVLASDIKILTDKNRYQIETNNEHKLVFECLSKGIGKGSLCQLSL